MLPLEFTLSVFDEFEHPEHTNIEHKRISSRIVDFNFQQCLIFISHSIFEL